MAKQARSGARLGHPAGGGTPRTALTPAPGRPIRQDVVVRPIRDWCTDPSPRAIARLLAAVASLDDDAGPEQAGTARVVDLAAYQARRHAASPQRRPGLPGRSPA